MEPANQPPVKPAAPAQPAPPWQLAFLADADALERRPMPGGASVTLYLLCALVLVAIVWASVFEVDQVVTAKGKLTTTTPNLVLQPLETAQVIDLPVRAGQVVKKGQVLAVLDPTFISADLNQARQRLNSLEAEVRRLERERHGQASAPTTNDRDGALQARLQQERTASYQARQKRLVETIERTKAMLVTNRQETAALADRVKSLLDIERMNEQLVQQQYQSNLRLLESRERRQEVEREWVAARNRQHELERQLAEAEAERQSFTQEWRQRTTEELVNTQRERDAVYEQVKKAERRSRLIELTSPRDAVVLEVAARPGGSIIREAEPLITLVPLDEPLVAEIQITASDIGYVKRTDRVRLKIDAFPFQKHGLILGELNAIGQDAFTPNTAGNNAPYYLGRATLQHNQLRKLPRDTPLLPGMTLSAEVVVGKRTVISYLMYPILRGLDEAIREP